MRYISYGAPARSVRVRIMKLTISSALAVLLLAAGVYAQKGVDTQTQKIKDESNKTTTRTGEPARTIDWGKGKTRVRELLANPYKFNSRRDVLVNTVLETLKENRMIVDEASSRLGDGLIVTQPYVFAKGAVTTPSELTRYGVLNFGDNAWSRAQYTLTIEVQPIDGIQHNVSVIAKVEGRAGSGLGSEWITVPSTGLAEDEFLAKLVTSVTGVSPDPVQDVEPSNP